MWWLLRTWLPIAVAVTGIALTIYGTVQQNYRQSLNDPQIRLAEDGAAILAAGGVPADVVPRTARLLDAATSLTPWIAVYDVSGKPLEASVSLGGKPPALPTSVLETAKAGKGKGSSRPNQNRVTWEPQEGVRQAIVVVWEPTSSRYVVAGRNMREVEIREWNLEMAVGIGWFVTLLATLFAAWLGTRFAMFRDQ